MPDFEHCKRIWDAQPDAAPVLRKHFTGHGTLIWCPYLNEPAFLEWIREDGKRVPDCPNCNRNFEPETHAFLFEVGKPRWNPESPAETPGN